MVDAGCDAFYFGGTAFGARAYANNLSPKEAEQACSYAHSRGVLAYLTVNTLIKNIELDRLVSYLKEYVRCGIDAVIVQDFSLFPIIRENFKDIKIHASTQMSIASPYGARFVMELGADRVVTAREISIAEIADIYDATGIEIETFIHGALCVSYSGQCLMSSMIGGRSGNRGRCAQPCRLSYGVYDDANKRRALRGDYPLSPKDLCGIEHIPKLSEAGVYSFKIEGRMKQTEYAAGVTRIYRKYLDRFLSDGAEHYRVEKKDMEALLDLGNRSGFTDLYYHADNGDEMISYTSPSHSHKKSKKKAASHGKRS